MGDANDANQVKAWERALKEQLNKHQDPDTFQQGIVKILLEMLEPSHAPPRAIEKEQRGVARRFLLPPIFGDVPRVRIIESLIARPDGWFNLADLAAVTGAGKATVKRIIDGLLAQELHLVEERPRGEETNERLVKLANTPLTRELRFLHVKLRGIL